MKNTASQSSRSVRRKSLLIIGILSLTALAIAFAGYVYSSHHTSSRTTITTTNTPIKLSGQKTSLTLVDQNGKPLANKQATLKSENGTMCATSPCPQNNLEFHGTTDLNGTIEVPSEYVQSSTTVNIDEFANVYASSCSDASGDSDNACVHPESEWFWHNPGYLIYQQGTSSYQIEIKDPRIGS